MVAGFHTGDDEGTRQIMPTDSTRRLHHETPSWVRPDAVFHIRIRIGCSQMAMLCHPANAKALLASAEYYHEKTTWFCYLLLIMPDHLHALISFPRDADMRLVVGRWKAWQTRTLGIIWQDNFFDHRIRNARELQLKADYIRQNPVVKGLCHQTGDWPWVIDSTRL